MDEWPSTSAHPHPGPLINDLLDRQDQHRSRAVFFGESSVLDVKRSDRHFWIFSKNLDPRIRYYIDVAGLGRVLRAGTIRIDHSLFTALIERWRRETHTFHLPIMGEATVTLQDVEVLWGLPIDGFPVILRHVRRSLSERKQLVYDLLGWWPEDTHMSDGQLKLTSLYRQLRTPIHPDAPDEVVRRYARMYILILFGGQLFADACGNLVSMNWLDYLGDLEAMGQYSWGGAVLACLYRRMCHAADASTKVTGGPYVLLQIWAWKRFPTIRPGIVQPLPLGDYPRAGRWATHRTTVDAPQHCLSHYRDQLSKLRLDQFIWEPYTEYVLSSLPVYCTRGQHIWRAKVPLILWHIVELHLPNRVMRQFGFHQDIPEPPNTNPTDIHEIKLAGYPGQDWGTYHKNWIALWNDRANAVIVGQPTNTFMPTDRYMQWYYNRTILYITPPIPNDPPRDGHQGDAGQFNYLIDNMVRIGYKSNTDLGHDDPTQTFHPGLTRIRNQAFGSMQYLQQMHRAGFVPIVPDASQDIQYQRPAQHVPSQIPRATREGRRRRRGTYLRDEDEGTSMHQDTQIGIGEGDHTNVETQFTDSPIHTPHLDVPPIHSPLVSTDITYSTSYADGAHTSFMQEYMHNTYDPFSTPSQIPAFGDSSLFSSSTIGAHFGDDIIFNFLAGPSGELSPIPQMPQTGSSSHVETSPVAM